jgi:hypothetical protein
MFLPTTEFSIDTSFCFTGYKKQSHKDGREVTHFKNNLGK